MSFEIKRAKRSKAFIKAGLSGTSGSGKTYSALLLAYGLVGDLGRVAIIDTENGSANLYTQLGSYAVVPFEPPFGPDRYKEAVDIFANDHRIDCLIIDSISHEWDGAGGCLQMHQNFGGAFRDWGKVTPRHQEFTNAILQAPCHVITTTRRKTDYAMEQINGKTTVKKLGLKEIQRDGWEYELTFSLAIDTNHYATSSKDRTGLFDGKAPFKITKQTGEQVKAWAAGEQSNEGVK